VTDTPSRRLRVLAVIASSDFGGAERAFASVLKGLDPDRFQVFVACHGQGPMADEYRRHAAGLWALPLTSIFDARSVVALAGLMRRLACEIVHSYLWTADVLAGLASALARVPIRLATVGGEYFRAVDDRGIRRARKALLSRGHRVAYWPFDRVIAVSRRTAEDLTSRAGIRVDPRKVITILNGFDLDRVGPTSGVARADLELAHAAPVLVTVANFVPMKGHRRLLEAMPGILARFPDATLVLAGSGPGLAAAREHVAAAGLVPRVRILGPRADGVDLLALSDVVVLPSVAAEGLPIVILEALALGKPVVATRVGGIPEVIQDGETGLLVPAGDPQALADAVSSLLADPARAAVMAARGREAVRARFSANGMVRQVERLYLELAAAKGLMGRERVSPRAPQAATGRRPSGQGRPTDAARSTPAETG
jgi:glycosyltransferase involved in cell wall biosynthesis